MKDFKEKLGKLTQAASRVMDKLSSKESLVAIDVGSHSIKIARLKKERSAKPTLDILHVIEINPQELPSNEDEKKAYLVRLLRAAFARFKIRNPLAAISVSGSSVIVREAKLPALPHATLKAALGVEAEPYLPFDVEEVYLDYHVTGQVLEKGEQKYSVLLVAAKKDFVVNRLALLTEIGVRPILVEVDSLAVVNAACLRPDLAKGSFVVCNIGASITNLVILENETPRLVRDIALGGAVFTRALQKELSLDPVSAEQAKKDMGLIYEEAELAKFTASNEEAKRKGAKAMVQVATDLMGEISKSMTFYLTHGVESKIQKVYFTGGGAMLKNLPAFASQHLKLPAEVMDPLESFNTPGGIVCGPAMSVVCGLALRQWNDWLKR